MVSAGDRVSLSGQGDGSVAINGTVVWGTDAEFDSGTEIVVIWVSSSGEKSDVLATYEVN